MWNKLIQCLILFFEKLGSNSGTNVQFTIRYEGIKIIGVSKMELREGQQVELTAQLLTSNGRPAAFQRGTEEWTSSDESVATVEPLTVNNVGEPFPNNELHALVKGVDGSENESVVITLRVDGDPDEDEERILIGTLDVVVTQGEATIVNIVAGTPEEIPSLTEDENEDEDEDEGEDNSDE